MAVLMATASVALIFLVLVDAFETMLLPRRVRRQFRFARSLLRLLLGTLGCPCPAGSIGEAAKHALEPVRAAVDHHSPGVLGCRSDHGVRRLALALATPLGGKEAAGLGIYAYFSGVTFFTLGYGDITPIEPWGRFLAVVETGVGFGFLAVIISYLPVLYQAFSRREVTISLLDARAGSPPTAGTFLGRLARFSDLKKLDQFLDEWERWAAEVLESHLSFPVLSYYRSQHDNQSWLAALTAILDTSALVVAAVPDTDHTQAWLAFAMSRHVVVDLAQTFYAPPVDPPTDRLPPERWKILRESLRQAGLELNEGEAELRRLTELRGMYEPFVTALSIRFLMPLPPVFIEGEPVDNWQTSAWMRRTRGFPAAHADGLTTTTIEWRENGIGPVSHARASEIDLFHDPRAVGQGAEKGAAVGLGHDPGVEDDHDPPVGPGPDQPAEALLELDHGFGDLVFHERVPSPWHGCLPAGPRAGDGWER